MKKIAVILALMLILGTVVISGCTTTKNNTTTGNMSNQSKGTGYSVGQVLTEKTGNNVNASNLDVGSGASGSIFGWNK
jgi:cytochrome oxidase Cu insertion factor (SCO1/SenC/PrrC family)